VSKCGIAGFIQTKNHITQNVNYTCLTQQLLFIGTTSVKIANGSFIPVSTLYFTFNRTKSKNPTVVSTAGFFHPSRRLGISSRVSVHIINKGRKSFCLCCISSRARVYYASPCGLMIYKASP
jgi:hypothetical protein